MGEAVGHVQDNSGPVGAVCAALMNTDTHLGSSLRGRAVQRRKNRERVHSSLKMSSSLRPCSSRRD